MGALSYKLMKLPLSCDRETVDPDGAEWYVYGQCKLRVILRYSPASLFPGLLRT